MATPFHYESLINRYLEARKEPQQPKPEPKPEPKENDELKHKLQKYEVMEKLEEQRKAINTRAKLKGADPVQRAEKMRKARITKRQQEEKDIVESFMDKDIEELKKEKRKDQTKIRLLKKFVKDVEKYQE
jgi:hypothetical protein